MPPEDTWDGALRRASDTTSMSIGERLATLEAIQGAAVKQVDVLSESFEGHKTDELDRLEKVYEAIGKLSSEISALRQDLSLAKGGISMAARFLTFGIPLGAGIWTLVVYFKDHVVTR